MDAVSFEDWCLSGFLMDQVRFSQASVGPLWAFWQLLLVRVLWEAATQMDKSVTFLNTWERKWVGAREGLGEPSAFNSSLAPVKERGRKTRGGNILDYYTDQERLSKAYKQPLSHLLHPATWRAVIGWEQQWEACLPTNKRMEFKLNYCPLKHQAPCRWRSARCILMTTRVMAEFEVKVNMNSTLASLFLAVWPRASFSIILGLFPHLENDNSVFSPTDCKSQMRF